MRDRTIKLLRTFIVSDFPISLTRLTEEFMLSERTIRNEINVLNDYLLENALPTLQTIRGKGLQLSITESQKKLLIQLIGSENQEQILTREERLLDLILSISIGKERVFLYQKENEFQISKSSLDEDMRRLRQMMKEYQVEIVSVPKEGLILSGKEKVIRTMIYSFVNKMVDNFTLTDELKNRSVKKQIIFSYISLEVFTKIDRIYDQCISASEDSLYRKNLVLFTSIWFTRLQNKGSLQMSAWVKKHSYTTPELKAFVQAIFETFSIQEEANERSYLTFMLDTFNPKNMNTSVEWGQAQMLSIQLIQHVEASTHIPFSKKEKDLQEGLYQHIGSLLSRVRYDVQFANPLKENIKSNYGILYQAVQSFTPEFTKLLGKELSEDEIAFLTIHFSSAFSELNQELSYFYRAVVICNHGVATGKLLSENLKELFNIEVLAVLSSREVALIEKLDVDLVFSTVPIEVEKKPLLIVEPIIKEDSKAAIADFLKQYNQYRRFSSNREDSTSMFSAILKLIENETKVTEDLYQELARIFRENQLSINTKELQPMIKDFLQDENILLNVEADDWQELITIVSQPLLKEEAITDKYIQAMIEAVEEFGPYIVIGEHLALAHARPEDGVNQLGLSVATVKTPVKFGHEENDPVKIIFCLSAVDSFSHLNIMRGLIDLINDEQKLNQLLQAETIEEFKLTLFN
ncbi:BglG family transcription antiterminator [Enterococcus saccharolyticus]|uniref:Transcription antiterminator BglG n=1 Tax=Candidatus Enterococcus willemsii TaxID=1857215 RepID=A0ABQ6YXF7_9ENTE|nr:MULTISPECIES: PTS sugar transporter subunit IIA [Enterococcus]KAF1302567.1 transcription antiterminator BglG [Enterococcus sp. CU12B]MCD5003030.1 BglG family transcription antiterminator [Enterococcus saccharolyticus]